MSSESGVIVVVGAGPGGTAMVERLIANAPAGRRLDIHVIDPYPPGGGRTWRLDQSPLMWMNSRATEVTMFTDETVEIAGPIRPGPAIHEWSAELGPDSFPSRQQQNAYLTWVFSHVVEAAPPHVSVRVHEATAEGLTETGGRQLVWLANPTEPDTRRYTGQQSSTLPS
ncbi:MAG: hypothetical protein JWN00_4778 [Actinomycetia bacterium]|nr:hypothetical protein [Actinomycetes bacterium]